MKTKTPNVPAAAPDPPPSLLQSIGSLWFGATVLVLSLVAMACATVYESMHTTPRALDAFYHSDWFAGLLALLSLSIVASLAWHFPYTKRRVGFVLTHASVLLILAGAVITQNWGIDGSLGVREGQTVHAFTDRVEALSLMPRGASAPVSDGASVDLPKPIFGGFEARTEPEAPTLVLGDVTAEVIEYVPNGTWQRDILNDNPQPRPAVRVTLGGAAPDAGTWIFADQRAGLGGVDALFRIIKDPSEWERVLQPPAPVAPATEGTVHLVYKDQSFDVPLAACTGTSVPLGDTGLSVIVHEYLPHAVVGSNNKTVNGSNQPVNPAIDVEVSGAPGSERRYVFARFPDFRHGESTLKDLQITFRAPSVATSAPIQVLVGPDGALHARFEPPGGAVTVHDLSVGQGVPTPFQGRALTVRQTLDRARIDWKIVPADPEAKDRTPAVRVALRRGDATQRVWVQKYSPRAVALGTSQFQLTYGERQLPLGFDVTLNGFRVGYYPGGMRPRSFESHVTLSDPTGAGKRTVVISMNHPATFGGYTLYQSSYNQSPTGPAVSYLSVSRDPGQPVVFAGYVLLMIGMLVVLGQRIHDRRVTAALAARAAHVRSSRARSNPNRELVHS